MNIACRWFLEYDLYDKIPHSTPFSQNYRRRFKDTDIFENISQNVLNQALEQGFVDEKIQFLYSTHVKAHANRHKNKQKVVARHIWQDYLDITKEYRYTNQGKKEYAIRKETIERQFVSTKEYHSFRYTNMKGKAKMDMKTALTFTCSNMKKLALMMYNMAQIRR